MIKKTITYTDYNGNERKEDFYFNLTKAEVLEMEMTTVGGMEAMVQNIVAAQDVASLVKIFKDLILRAYGVRSADGREFMKTEALSQKFACNEAYSILFMELATNAEAAAAFVNGLAPNPTPPVTSPIYIPDKQ